MSTRYKSWAYTPPTKQSGTSPLWTSDIVYEDNTLHLPFGNGRSYGDSCLVSSGILLDSQHLNHIIEFDSQSGTITCESGITFEEIINVVANDGWFLPVTPGTRFVTVGGAVANDVHGKNHHRRGTFGCHIIELEILRSDGTRIVCSPSENTELFCATIGGLGLTGFILWAKFSLIPIQSSLMTVDSMPFRNLEEFYEISRTKHDDYEYSVAWLDCSAKGQNFGRGIYFGGNHSAVKLAEHTKRFQLPKPTLTVPFNLPSATLNSLFVSAFNTLYFHKNKRVGLQNSTPMSQYFYPLDNISHWYRIYGKKGFFQYQFVVPIDCTDHLAKILAIITNTKSASFLAVLKEFGSIPSPGLLSFPKPGYCLALDFPNKGPKTEQMIESLDHIVRDAGGSVYPAKDRLMSSDAFKQYYPNYEAFTELLDPGMSSDFWKRVNP